MVEEKKVAAINELNKNYRTILSYGDDGIVPVGEFIVIDIREEEAPPEQNEAIDPKRRTVVLGKVDDDGVQIVLPFDVFLTRFAQLAAVNANKLDIGSNLSKGVENVEEAAERKTLFDGIEGELVDAEMMTLNESSADYLINGEVQSSNYSICPIDIGLYRERIREKLKSETDDKPPMDGLIIRQDLGEERNPYPDSDDYEL